MHTIFLTIDTANNAKLLATFLSTVKTVKSVSIDPEVQKEYKWTNPLRPATDEEFELMIQECEEEENLTLEQSKKLSAKKIKKWIKEQKLK
jgi:uncharacterized protein involved in tolerance to divalent cations